MPYDCMANVFGEWAPLVAGLAVGVVLGAIITISSAIAGSMRR